MIKSIEITNHLGESTIMDLRFPEKSGFLVRGTTGLGPSKAVINTSEMAAYDGSMFNSAHIGSRNIVFNLGFLPSPTIEDTRHNSYQYFPLKRRIKIKVTTDRRTSETYGYVESNEPDIFSKEEGCVVSVLCPNAYFLSVKKDVSVFSNIETLFEFPFSNEVSIESPTQKNLLFGDIENRTIKSVLYNGDAAIGVVITIHAMGPAGGITIVNYLTSEKMIIDGPKLATILGSTVPEIIAGDDIIISTIKGDKYIKFQRDGVLTNIQNALDKNADWFELEKGDNLFSYITDPPEGALNLQFRMESQIAYEGV